MNIIYLLIPLCCGFVLKPKIITTKLYSKLPDMWDVLSSTLKENARNWFIQRAENKGIDWNGLSNQYQLENNTLQIIYDENINNSMVYPSYYTRPFHGYDEGNLNWKAAYEGEAATLSMAVNYWKNIDPITTEYWLRHNISENIKTYIRFNNLKETKSILDVGSSVGISTEYLNDDFENINYIYGIDLSPHFIALATYRSYLNNNNIKYYHRNAEEPNLIEKFDLIVCNFILHEIPSEPTKKILQELYNILNKNGVLAVVDLDPSKVKNNLIVSNFRKWAFEVTEPHIYEYYSSNMTSWLGEVGLKNTIKVSNDPINSIWMGVKY